MTGISNDAPIISKVNILLENFDYARARYSSYMNNHNNIWIWNAAQDTRYSHVNKKMENVIHVFHQEWHGIRAAAGSLPGIKLAIPETSLSDIDISSLVLQIVDKDASRIVFHGYSQNTGTLIRRLSNLGIKEKLFFVFHGSPAQWWNEIERRFAFEAIECAQSGLLQSIHIMKNGMELPNAPLFKPLLYNLSPMHADFGSVAERSEIVSAFVPGWGNWIKNVFGTAFGASLSKNVQQVWAFATGLHLPSPLNEKLVLLAPTSREDTFKRYASATVTLNVSLIDCHPMVNVECQSVGRPCIRSDLNLDAYENHEYVKLVSVRHNNSPSDIRDAVDRTIRVPNSELTEMVYDYQRKIDAVGINRYIEFLQL